MNYNQTIEEILACIHTLEEKVKLLSAQYSSNSSERNENNMEKTNAKKTRTEDIRQYISSLLEDAKAQGKPFLTLTAKEIHHELQLKNRYPMVCNAMRQTMGKDDEILFSPPKGNSSTLKIKYYL